MKSFQEKLPYIALFLFLISFLSIQLKIILCVLFLCVYLYKYRDVSILLVCILFGIYCFPYYKNTIPLETKGRVIQVSDRYIVLKNGRYKWIVYTEEEILLDSIVQCKGDFNQIESNKGFYRFDFKRYSNLNGIYYAQNVEDIIQIKQPYTIRGLLYKRICDLDDKAQSLLLKRILFQVKDEDLELNSFLYHRGFSYLAIIQVIDTFLKKRKYDKERLKYLLAINTLFCILFHFPYVLVQSLFMKLIPNNYSKMQKISIFVLLTLLFFPSQIYSILFWFLFIQRCFRKQMNSMVNRITIVSILQSIFFYEMNPILSFLYSYLLKGNGIIMGLSFITIFLPNAFFNHTVYFYDEILSIFNQCTLPGTVLGYGLIFYVLFIIAIRKRKYSRYLILISLFVFQYFGLFHPIGEVTYINVGQGDAILLRMPMNQENILIDTGKPIAQKTLETYLKAKAIKRIDTLIITHMDDDHSGNMDSIIEKYHPSNVITNHQEEKIGNKFHLMDLNRIQNEDLNQSSIVTYMEMNGLKYLFMGDADEVTEEEIIEEYPQLKCDLLKASHHGSKTGSSDKFLDIVQPKIGIFSCGRYSIYHHPSIETIQRFLQRHILYYSTYEEGDISVFPFFRFNIMITSNGKLILL